MANNDLVSKEFFTEEHQVTWIVTDFAKIKISRQALDLQHFDIKVGASIDVPSKFQCFLQCAGDDGHGHIGNVQPDVQLVGDIPENGHFLTVVAFETKCGKTIRFKADTYQTSQVSMIDLFPGKVDLLRQPLDKDGSLSLNVKFYICNINRIPSNISHNTLMVSFLTWFYETQFINKWQTDFRKMYTKGFGDLNSGDGTLEMKIITKDGQEFVPNRAILGVRTPVFYSMFQTPMLEAQNGIVKIDDISGPAFDALLSFMYTGVLPGNWKEPEILEELIYGAFKYMMEDLQQFFESILVFLCNEEGEEENKQNLEQLADMLNIKMEEDWNICLDNLVKDCLGLDSSDLDFIREEFKLREMEPRLLMALICALLP